MKNKRAFILLLFIIIFITLVAGSKMFTLSVIDSENTFNIMNFIRYFFLDNTYDIFNEIPASNLLLFFSFLLFCGYILLIQSFDTSRKYRAITMIRYGSKKRFFFSSVISIAKRSLYILLGIKILFFLSTRIFDMQFKLSEGYIIKTFILVLNIYLFLFLIGVINFFCLLKYNDSVSIIVVSVFTGFISITDAFGSTISVITLGNLFQMLLSSVILILTILSTLISTYKNIKHNDLL